MRPFDDINNVVFDPIGVSFALAPTALSLSLGLDDALMVSSVMLTTGMMGKAAVSTAAGQSVTASASSTTATRRAMSLLSPALVLAAVLNAAVTYLLFGPSVDGFSAFDIVGISFFVIVAAPRLVFMPSSYYDVKLSGVNVVTGLGISLLVAAAFLNSVVLAAASLAWTVGAMARNINDAMVEYDQAESVD